MKKISVSVHFFEYNSMEELEKTEQTLLQKAKEITASAYAPYSGFFVGAAVLMENGEIVCGTNQENSAYPSGICAERVALFYASTHYPKMKIKALAVSAQSKSKQVTDPVMPCGSCRQVIAEYEGKQNEKIKLIFSGETGKVLVTNGIKSLLPFSFTNKI